MVVRIIKKVRVLTGKAEIEAFRMGLTPDDLVIMDNEHIVAKIEGDPVSFLLKRAGKT